MIYVHGKCEMYGRIRQKNRAFRIGRYTVVQEKAHYQEDKEWLFIE